jgi:AcrR family transcriptional regulator
VTRSGLAEAAARMEGMRERKKRERRAAIAAHALTLFATHGFENVTIREIAQAADGSEPTVFNYFPTKESLVFHEDRARESALVDAVRERAVGETVLDAFQARALDVLDRDWRETLVEWIRVVQSSSRLQQYRRELYARHAHTLADLLRQEHPELETVTAESLARALMGVVASAHETLGQRILTGQAPRRVGPSVRAEAERAFELLGRGLAEFGRRQPAQRRPRKRIESTR